MRLGTGRLGLVSYVESPAPSFLFDLDGTLIDSVYQHVIAWRAALSRIGIDLSVWRIHRRIGMSGGLFVSALLRETGRSLSAEDIEELQQAHAAQYRAQMDSVTRAARGARAARLAHRGGRPVGHRDQRVRGHRAARAGPARAARGHPDDHPGPGAARQARPRPVPGRGGRARRGPRGTRWWSGDSVWDLLAARRAGALGVGLMSGGYGREELERAGAYRVYADPAEMLARIDELGVRADG